MVDGEKVACFSRLQLDLDDGFEVINFSGAETFT